MKKSIIKCPCGAQAHLRPASVVYGESAGKELLYVCSRYPVCDCYVGVHKNSLKPLGTLADAAVRRKRIEAHQIFNQIWKSGLMEKQQAYIWLQAKLGLNERQTHIAKFSAYMCDQVIAICNQALNNIRRAA